jgi:AraC-like DNA-binding protein
MWENRRMGERLFLRLEGDPVKGPEATVPSHTLRTFSVSPSIEEHVSQVLLYRERIKDGCEVVERVVPDGAVRLVFNLGDAPSAKGAKSFRTEAIGAFVSPSLVHMRGAIVGLSITLRAGAAAAILGVPAGDIAGTAVDLADLWGRDGVEALERIAEQIGDAAKARTLQEILSGRIRRAPAARSDGVPAAMSAARRAVAESGRVSVRELAAAIGVGERRLQQLFHEHVGLSPRAWCRLARFHGCLRALRRQPDVPWAELALSAGFYDQSHLANDFRAIAGITPSEFRDAGISGSSKTPD